jgi:hypothetical protein
MGRDIRAELFHSFINFARANHADLIDKAYEYFWEEDDPEDFLGGTALSLGFINFEDWLICDYKTEDGKSITDLYTDASEGLEEKDLRTLEAMKDSYISIYEAVSVGDKVTLKDLLLDEEFTTEHESLKSLNKGDIFASRFIAMDGERIMSRCVYPYSNEAKDHVLENFGVIYKRYLKNKNPEGTVRDFIKEESYTFNLLWLDNIFKSRRSN